VAGGFGEKGGEGRAAGPQVEKGFGALAAKAAHPRCALWIVD
jgi:hypothetical protein